jgi:maltose alpha-D-glucosyltransferase / alpha-amylase
MSGCWDNVLPRCTLLASDQFDPAFAPEPFTTFYMRGRHHSLAGMARSVMANLRQRHREAARSTRELAAAVLALEPDISQLLSNAPDAESAGMRIRVHGDLHLGQILHTGDDLVFIDFEGDNTLPLRERVLKRSPLVDVAGVLLSVRYAAMRTLASKTDGWLTWRSRVADLERWIRLWLLLTTGTCLHAYRRAVSGSPIVPAAEEDFRRLLDVHLVAKAVYQAGYDLQNRPEWAPVALRTLPELVMDSKEVRG